MREKIVYIFTFIIQSQSLNGTITNHGTKNGYIKHYVTHSNQDCKLHFNMSRICTETSVKMSCIIFIDKTMYEDSFITVVQFFLNYLTHSKSMQPHKQYHDISLQCGCLFILNKFSKILQKFRSIFKERKSFKLFQLFMKS